LAKSRGKIIKRLFFSACIFLLFLSPLYAERYALVIGNAAYQNIQPLSTPVNDATDIAAGLKALGYKVDLCLNVGINDMEQAVSRFTDLLAKDKDNEGFFWYAGHGVQADNENFLLPVDMMGQNLSQLKRTSYSLNDLLQEMELAHNAVNVVILDACRNNPLPAESRAVSRGLAIAPAVQDTFIMFSTAAGAVADDGGPGVRNSPFTQAFLKYMVTPEGLDSVAKDVSRETIAITGTVQRPFISDNILFVKDYSLYPKEGGLVIMPQPLNPAYEPAQSRPSSGSGQPASFSLDNTSAWSLGLSFAANPAAGFDQVHPGGLLSYTFLERFKTRGERFFAPNAYFVNFMASMGTITVQNKSETFGAFFPGLGFLWKLRPDAAQRMLLGAGLSANLLMGSLQYRYNRDSKNVNVSDFMVEPMAGLHGNYAFRFTPLIALELNLAWYLDILGSYPLGDGSSYNLNFLQAALGVSIILPYGKSR